MKHFFNLLTVPVVALYLFVVRLWYCVYVVNILESKGIETYLDHKKIVAILLVAGAIRLELKLKQAETTGYIEAWAKTLIEPPIILAIAVVATNLIVWAVL